MRTKRFVAWLEDVSAGDPASIALAIPLGLAVFALVVLSVRQARADRHPAPSRRKKLRWPADAPPPTQGLPDRREPPPHPSDPL
jgi:hypothetical protein